MVLWKEAEPVQQEEICSSRWLSLLLQALNKIEAGKTFQWVLLKYNNTNPILKMTQRKKIMHLSFLHSLCPEWPSADPLNSCGGRRTRQL
jgi:hypothetical protein